MDECPLYRAVRTSVDKIRIAVFQCVYMDSTVKQKERQGGKRGMVKGCVFVHEIARK